MNESFVDKLCFHFKSGTPVLAINSSETPRVMLEIEKAAWKTGDGTLVTFKDKNQLTPYRQSFARITFEAAALFKNATQIIYNSTFLIELLQHLEGLIARDEGDPTELGAEVEMIRNLLNTAYTVVEWNLIDGYSVGNKGQNSLEEALTLAAADRCDESLLPKNAVLVFRDAQDFLNTNSRPHYREILRNLVEHDMLSARGHSNHHIVFVQPDWTPHLDIQSDITFVEFGAPTEEHFDREITYIEGSIESAEGRTCPAELRSDLCRALRGFTQQEAVNALAYCVSKHRGFCVDMLQTIISLQKAAFSKTGILTMVDYDEIEPVEDIGGFENYFEFLEEAMLCYSPEAKAVSLAKAKGCLLLGIPGTGKSLVARATAKKMKLPLLVYDFGAQFGGVIGQTEANQRQVLKQIKAKGPCVLMLDEFDKVAAGSVGGYQGDSGVNQRSMGRLLSWMANENDEAFVIMTMNRTKGVPPEMLRAGRLDAIFYTTFPSQREREEILNIHLRKNGAAEDCLDHSDLMELVFRTESYVGAELEQVVKKAIRTAWKERREVTPTKKELLAACNVVTPVVRLDKENVESIEDFCKGVATPVSKPDVKPRPSTKGGRSIKVGS